MKLIKEIKRSDQLSLVVGLAVVGSLLFFVLNRPIAGQVLIALSALLLPIFAFSDYLTKVIITLWLKLAALLGWVNSRILLSLVFFILLTPIALIARLFRKDRLKLSKKSSFTFVTRNHVFTKTDMENPW